MEILEDFQPTLKARPHLLGFCRSTSFKNRANVDDSIFVEWLFLSIMSGLLSVLIKEMIRLSSNCMRLRVNVDGGNDAIRFFSEIFSVFCDDFPWSHRINWRKVELSVDTQSCDSMLFDFCHLFRRVEWVNQRRSTKIE